MTVQLDRRDTLHAKRMALTDLMLKMQELRDECLATGDEIDAVTARDMEAAIADTKRKLDALNRVAQEGDITDEMVEQARAVDTGTLVKFVHGRTVGFCHDGDNPTAFVRLPSGKAYCHVCCKTFNAVDILVQRDGYKFPDAVRYLCQTL